MTTPITVGIAGAGPWARAVHAPLLAAGPETTLAGVWSRSRAHAAELAGQYRAVVFDTFDDLLDRCDAVTFAVPPSVQAELAVLAARRGRPMLLEKPLGLNLDDSSRVAGAIADAGVGCIVNFTYRFSPTVRRFLDETARFPTTAARGSFLSGAFLAATPGGERGWRGEHGCLIDVGPHILDLVDAASGPVVEVEGHGSPFDLVSLSCQHEQGTSTEVTISCSRAVLPSITDLTLYSRAGAPLHVDGRADDRSLLWATLRAEFAAVARSTIDGRGALAHPCDVHRALHVQRVIAMAADALGRGRRL